MYRMSRTKLSEIKKEVENLTSMGFVRPRYGHYEYTVLPFRLINAPDAFMSVLNDLFKDYTDSS